MHTYLIHVADAAASREVSTLADFYGVGSLIVSKELTYDVARDSLIKLFAERNLAASAVKVYVSQGYALAQLFDTFDDVEAYADDVCKGSRSLKRIYDSTRVKADKADKAEGTAEAEAEAPATALVDVILANLAHLTDKADVERVRMAAASMLSAL